ncbi:hypothetical protein V1525DRAFT_275798 [Lipomyces kononenkoae]|uniref:Uncharacterized protein n=1 Tax=Lipomyces kononenkoae TaxID=34357 RepID=A0ACC3SUI3_LIPKO
MTYTVTTFLTVLVTTFEWLQYGHLVRSCLQTPQPYTDCLQVFPGYGIPQYYDLQNWNVTDPQTDCYLYTCSDFYGWQRANFTVLKPALLNATAATLIHACNANSTCRNLYKATVHPDSQITAMLESNLDAIISQVPKSGNYRLIPNNYVANALSFYTSMPSSYTEVMGFHNWQTAAYKNYTITSLGYQYAYALQLVLSGGASRFESLINMIAFYSYDVNTETLHGNGQLTYKRRKRAGNWQQERDEALRSIGFRDKIADLKALSELRGSDRDIAKSMNYNVYFRNNIKPGAMAYKLVERQCDGISPITEGISLTNAINEMCDIAQVATSFYSLTKIGLPSNTFSSIVGALANQQYNTIEGSISITAALCRLTGPTANCFPSVTVFNTVSLSDLNTALGLALATFSTAAAFTTGAGEAVAAANLGVTVGCAINGWVHDNLVNVNLCCAKSCNGPTCQAAKISCNVAGTPC